MKRLNITIIFFFGLAVLYLATLLPSVSKLAPDNLNIVTNVSTTRIPRSNLQADDVSLVELVRRKMVPPSTKMYNLATIARDTSMGQAAVVAHILDYQKDGFFVECGALDGEVRSNTYYFERVLGWSGILIEADPHNFALLLKKNRKAFALNACLSENSTEALFFSAFNAGRIVSRNSTLFLQHSSSVSRVYCFPLWTVLLALERTTIDYFSLDVEGSEFDVLRGIPFDRLRIRVMSVEWTHVPEGKDVLQRFVERKGFKMVAEVNNANNLANDFIFVQL